MGKFYNLLYKYQRYLLGMAIFACLMAVAVTIEGKDISLAWRDSPFIACVALALGLLLFWGYIQLDKWRINQLTRQIRAGDGMPKTGDFSQLETLTDRQRQVYDLIVQGKSNKEITSSLFIEQSTLKTHINQIYKKLDIRDRSALKRYANTGKQ